MAEHSVPVDLFNPGQVFACLGLLEAADILLGDAEGGFDWPDEADTRFHLRSAGDDNPVEAVLRFLAEAEVKTTAPYGSQNRTDKWKVETLLLDPGEPFPFPDPSSPATLPACLEAHGKVIVLDNWGDATTRDNVKFWAGAGGYPGAALTVDALRLVDKRIAEAISDPFALSAPQSSSFRFDWRRDYIPLDAGFSPNDHGDVAMMGYPLVELLAAVGLSHARPQRLRKLEYRYGVVGRPEHVLLDPVYLRAALGCSVLPFRQRTFRMQLGWPGQENQARCILDVTEEPYP
ncbi:MAG: type I-U CRISPR-associated protein Cas8c [Pseudomonadota bacterium]|nr:type I-U CRISPR-associated protein Cas8c [Pseudomonadota bacterium]